MSMSGRMTALIGFPCLSLLGAGCVSGADVGFLVHWLILIVAVVVLAIVALEMGEEAWGGIGCLGLIVGGATYFFGGPALILALVWPGCTMPSTEIQEIQARTAAQQAEELRVEKLRRSTPQGQLESAIATKKELTEHLDGKVKPLLAQYRSEHSGYIKTLRRDLPKSGLKSHEELLRDKDSYLELYITLERSAMLEHSIAWLEQNEKASARALLQIDQERWRLQKVIEMNEVVNEGDDEAIIEMLASARATIDSQLPVPDRQDIASYERELFDKVLGGQ